MWLELFVASTPKLVQYMDKYEICGDHILEHPSFWDRDGVIYGGDHDERVSGRLILQ